MKDQIIILIGLLILISLIVMKMYIDDCDLLLEHYTPSDEEKELMTNVLAPGVDGTLYKDYTGVGENIPWITAFKDKEYGGGDANIVDYIELKYGDELELWSQESKNGDYALSDGWKFQSLIIKEGVTVIFKCIYGSNYNDYYIVKIRWNTLRALDLANDIQQGLFDHTSQQKKMSEAVSEVLNSKNFYARIILRFDIDYLDMSGPGEGKYPTMIYKYIGYRTKLGVLGADDPHERHKDYGSDIHICYIELGYKKYITFNSIDFGKGEKKGGRLVFTDSTFSKAVPAYYQDVIWYYNAIKTIPGTKIYLKVIEEMYHFNKDHNVNIDTPIPLEYEVFFKFKKDYQKKQDYDYKTDNNEIIKVLYSYELLDTTDPYFIEKRISLIPLTIESNIPNLSQWLESLKDIDDPNTMWGGHPGFIRYKPNGTLNSQRSYSIYLRPESEQTETEKTYKESLSAPITSTTSKIITAPITTSKDICSNSLKNMTPQQVNQCITMGQFKGISPDKIGQFIDDSQFDGIPPNKIGQFIDDGQFDGIPPNKIDNYLTKEQVQGLSQESLMYLTNAQFRDMPKNMLLDNLSSSELVTKSSVNKQKDIIKKMPINVIMQEIDGDPDKQEKIIQGLSVDTIVDKTTPEQQLAIIDKTAKFSLGGFSLVGRPSV